jgi:hypothetical protein
MRNQAVSAPKPAAKTASHAATGTLRTRVATVFME